MEWGMLAATSPYFLFSAHQRVPQIASDLWLLRSLPAPFRYATWCRRHPFAGLFIAKRHLSQQKPDDNFCRKQSA